MKIIRWEEAVEAGKKNEPFFSESSITVGSFDGLHLGHQALLKKLRDDKHAGTRGVVTFVRPTRIEKGGTYFGDLLTLRQKLEKLEAWSLDFALLIEFSNGFAKTDGRDFFAVLSKALHIKALFVGEGFSCGYRHSADTESIKHIAAELGFYFETIPRVRCNNTIVSSSSIRALLKAGDVGTANTFLGYRFTLDLRDIRLRPLGESSWQASNQAFCQVLPKTGQYEVLAHCPAARETKSMFTVHENYSIFMQGGCINCPIQAPTEIEFRG